MTEPAADTYDQLEQAIRNHIAAIGDGTMLTDWVLTAASVGGFNGTGYTHIRSQATAAHAHLGLALATYRHAKAEWDNDDDEDGDE